MYLSSLQSYCANAEVVSALASRNVDKRSGSFSNDVNPLFLQADFKIGTKLGQLQ